jgi:hypothetical protein
MSTRRLPFMLLTIPALVVACGSPAPVESPPAPAAAPAGTTAPAAVSATPTAAPAATAAAEAPREKPVKEKIIGKWELLLKGDVLKKAFKEAAAKSPRSNEKHWWDEQRGRIAAEVAREWVELADGWFISHFTDKGSDKVVLKVKYEVVKEDGASVTIKPAGKPEVGQMDEKAEITITLTEDDTIEMPDPTRGTLIFGRKNEPAPAPR